MLLTQKVAPVHMNSQCASPSEEIFYSQLFGYGEPFAVKWAISSGAKPEMKFCQSSRDAVVWVLFVCVFVVWLLFCMFVS